MHLIADLLCLAQVRVGTETSHHHLGEERRGGEAVGKGGTGECEMSCKVYEN